MLRENTRLEIPNASVENILMQWMYMRPVIFHRFRQISTVVHKSRDLSPGKRAQIIAPH